MKHLIPFALLTMLLFSCNNNTPKVVYQQSADSLSNPLLIDTLAIVVAGLPVHFDGTNHLLHLVGKTKPHKSGRKAFMSSYSSGSSSNNTSFYYRGQSSVSGDIDNVRFQHIDSSSYVNLTNKQLIIKSIDFIGHKDVSEIEPVLLYNIIDQDTNKDLELNGYDIESLYISNSAGQHFKKLTPHYEELIKWELIVIQKRIYFITSEDINKDGKFNKTDKFHYYFIDLMDKNKKVIEYNPLP
ncbi:MAG: hypothetical protein N4A71_09870 [Carboxylicivirga sp.]|jgi:hypothetical protein|nr:hypothetical protein [Carboxylicivirga sp.]